MRLGILSDTHDQLARTRLAVQLLKDHGADVLIHCGDLAGPEIVKACAVLPCYFVFGNHDADRVPELRRAAVETGAVCLEWGGEILLAGKRVAVTHGHMHTDVRRLLAAGPDYLFSGHSHIPTDRYEDQTRRINPGALHDTDSFTVALLDLVSEGLKFLPVQAEDRVS
ncbi:metallophosphoesterase family protein [Fimbriiglobus ruber]|uniref:Phosphoesterase n=1 Tax=Fimbriiglobus ruber TaxID=1908690 RepID=A0A225DWI6_9BACT|nr:metallophosphoesterase family protein [Fimbriiglobus ruber]OWK43934.1 hypothetical protein FRUB_03533 [Fimbriiglobus ruber]